ncbi:MAG: glycosyltransferase, partial [Candidatus Omnitrophica bacterium]|nr:glycosyltransferase [Candidatus Omnitrophota bacterium]
SIIIPVKNEESFLRQCLSSLEKLDYPRDCVEVIVVDGESSDTSRDIALSCGVRVLRNPRQTVVSGRNLGFKEARGELVAFSDADCIFDPQWMKNAVGHFSDYTVGGIGGKTFTCQESGDFEKAVDFLFQCAEMAHATAHRQQHKTTEEVRDIPGCNAVYRREALQRVMPIEESLLTNEDVWLNFMIRHAGYRLLAVADVVLWHRRCRAPGELLRQMYRFAIGRVQVGKKHPSLFNIFHWGVGISIPLFFLITAMMLGSGRAGLYFSGNIVFWIFIMIISYLSSRSLKQAFIAPIVILLFLWGWSAGFLKEWIHPVQAATQR